MIRCPRCAALYPSAALACSQCRWAPPRIGEFVSWTPEFDGGTALRDSSFDLIAQHENGHFWFRARNTLIVRTLRRYAPGFRTFMEIGCGTGAVLSAVRDAFPDAALTGTELSPAGLAFAAERIGGARLMQMDGYHIPYEDEFDAIGAFDVLEHVDRDDVVLSQMHQALARRGVAFITVPQHQWLWSGVDDYSRHCRRYSRRELTGKLQQAGFAVAHVTSFMTAILPGLVLSRAMTADASRLDPAGELKVGPIVNAICGALCACESAILARGWSLPVGGSLLAVARKA